MTLAASGIRKRKPPRLRGGKSKVLEVSGRKIVFNIVPCQIVVNGWVDVPRDRLVTIAINKNLSQFFLWVHTITSRIVFAKLF